MTQQDKPDGVEDPDVCPNPATSFHDGHLFRMEACTSDNEKWVCARCGAVEYKRAGPRTVRLMRALNGGGR